MFSCKYGISIFTLGSFSCQQSLDSSCDMVCLKERIQKSQEEQEKREERLLQAQTLQQTGSRNKQTTSQSSCLHSDGSRVWNLSESHGLPSIPVTDSLFLDVEDEEEMLCFADPSRFITDPDFCYQEFARRDEDHLQVLRVQVRPGVGKRERVSADAGCKLWARICLISNSVPFNIVYFWGRHK